MPLVVAKVGGSLFDLADLGPRLRRWLGSLAAADVLLVPGGGAAADVVRDLDRRHGLGDEQAHWLALRATTLNAHVLAALLPPARVLYDPRYRDTPLSILDPYAFVRGDDGRPGCLPHSWAVTTDAVAARIAVREGAARLFLLKSVTIPPDLNWEEAARQGMVDPAFAGVVRQAPRGMEVAAVNLRA